MVPICSPCPAFAQLFHDVIGNSSVRNPTTITEALPALEAFRPVLVQGGPVPSDIDPSSATCNELDRRRTGYLDDSGNLRAGTAWRAPIEASTACATDQFKTYLNVGVVRVEILCFFPSVVHVSADIHVRFFRHGAIWF